ncbi:MAG: transposase [Clostridiales bacterium]|nr:transposase [Clostridiales bacterium]
MTRKNYTPEFKTKVVLEVLKEESELNAIASNYGLNPNMVRTWRREFLDKASSIFENPAKSQKEAKRKEAILEKKNTQMLKTIGQLTIERDFLQECFRSCGLPIPELDQETR